jgi:hypothetical protein
MGSNVTIDCIANSDTLAKELSDLGIDTAKAELVISEARATLQPVLGRIWREHIPCYGRLECTPEIYVAFYNAFSAHAKQVLSGNALLLEARDVETHLKDLRASVISCILEWLEPDPLLWGRDLLRIFEDTTPSGEWERLMSQTYGFFRIKHPPPLSAELTYFEAYFQTRLRHEEHRQVFRLRIESTLQEEMTLIEAVVRKHQQIHGDRPRAEKPALLIHLTQANTGETHRCGLNWKQVKIRFLSEFRVQITVGDVICTLNYEELGFADRRSRDKKKPNSAWLMLRQLAEAGGIIHASETHGDWTIVEKRMQEVRKALRRQFGISEDPVPFVNGIGYQAQFVIGCSPSYET